MLEELCRELRNWFDVERLIGRVSIKDGVVLVDGRPAGAKVGQYFRVIGSVFNDGVYKQFKNPATMGLVDEDFDGAIWLMAVPKVVLALAEDIGKWQAQYGAVDGALMSPYSSESFGGYSYSKSGGGASESSGGAGAGTWQAAFSSRLKNWRKV